MDVTILLIMKLIFILFSNSNFIKSRKRERERERDIYLHNPYYDDDVKKY